MREPQYASASRISPGKPVGSRFKIPRRYTGHCECPEIAANSSLVYTLSLWAGTKPGTRSAPHKCVKSTSFWRSIAVNPALMTSAVLSGTASIVQFIAHRRFCVPVRRGDKPGRIARPCRPNQARRRVGWRDSAPVGVRVIRHRTWRRSNARHARLERCKSLEQICYDSRTDLLVPIHMHLSSITYSLWLFGIQIASSCKGLR
jgi:hypothetical protein